jgi:hypothetical protein
MGFYDAVSVRKEFTIGPNWVVFDSPLIPNTNVSCPHSSIGSVVLDGNSRLNH